MKNSPVLKSSNTLQEETKTIKRNGIKFVRLHFRESRMNRKRLWVGRSSSFPLVMVVHLHLQVQGVHHRWPRTRSPHGNGGLSLLSGSRGRLLSYLLVIPHWFLPSSFRVLLSDCTTTVYPYDSFDLLTSYTACRCLTVLQTFLKYPKSGTAFLC